MINVRMIVRYKGKVVNDIDIVLRHATIEAILAGSETLLDMHFIPSNLLNVSPLYIKKTTMSTNQSTKKTLVEIDLE